MSDHVSSRSMRVCIARDRASIEACKALVSEVYLRDYGVRMTEGRVNPIGFRERFPDRFAMGLIDGQLVACAGLYVGTTYVEQFGLVTERHIRAALQEAGYLHALSRPRVEYTKVVVKPEWSGRGLGRRFIGMTHARDFLLVRGRVPLLLVCAKQSTFALWEAVGIRTRHLREFPWYRNHERYRSTSDPMESRLVIPELDIDRRWYELRFAVEEPESFGVSHAV